MAKKGSKIEETRRSPRFTRVLSVDLKVFRIPPTSAGRPLVREGQDFAGRTINISEDGILINSDFELDRDTILDITIMTGTDGEPPIISRTKVAWARRNAFDMFGRWAMGLKIMEMDPSDLNKLKEFFSGDPS